MNPACPMENCPVKPLIRFRLTARMMLIPAREMICRKYGEIENPGTSPPVMRALARKRTPT
jgi:hypothetical protein